MVSGGSCKNQVVKDWAVQAPAIESVAEFAKIRLQVLCACTVIGAIQKGFCVSNDCVEPFQVLP